MSKEAGKEVVDWKARLAARAQEVQQDEQAAVVQLSLASGMMSIAEQAIPGNKLPCVILAMGTERTWYDRPYDADDKSPPDCYSQKVGNDDPFNPTMTPAANVPEPPAKDCASCPNSKMGSAATGRGPACKTRRRLVVAPASIVNDPTTLGKQVLLVNVPPTSGRNFQQYVAKLATQGVPPEAAVTEISYGPSKKVMFEMKFDLVAPVQKDEALAAIFGRQSEFIPLITTGYNYPDEDEAPAPAKKGSTKY